MISISYSYRYTILYIFIFTVATMGRIVCMKCHLTVVDGSCGRASVPASVAAAAIEEVVCVGSR